MVILPTKKTATKRPAPSWGQRPATHSGRRSPERQKKSRGGRRSPERQKKSTGSERPTSHCPEKKSTGSERADSALSREVHGRAPTGGGLEGERQSSNVLHTPAQFRRGLTHHARPSRPDAWIPFSGTSCPNMHCSNCSATARALREELTDTLHSTSPRVRKTAAPLPRAVRERLPPAVRPSTGGRRTHRRSPPPAALARRPWLWPLLVGEGCRPPCQLFPYRSRQAGRFAAETAQLDWRGGGYKGVLGRRQVFLSTKS
jgi:hypothetical protein